jgi:NAD+ kinase
MVRCLKLKTLKPLLHSQVLTNVLKGEHRPVSVRRIKLTVAGRDHPVPALNDVLLAHPNPAAVTRCSFW